MFLAGTGIIYLHLPVYLCTAGGRGLLSRRTCAVRFSNRPIGVYQSLLLLYIPCFILLIPCSVVFVILVVQQHCFILGSRELHILVGICKLALHIQQSPIFLHNCSITRIYVSTLGRKRKGRSEGPVQTERFEAKNKT